METIFIKRYIKSEADLPKQLLNSNYSQEYHFEGNKGRGYYGNYHFRVKEWKDINSMEWIPGVDYWLEEIPPPTDEECVHPYHSVIGGDGQPEKCLKCGEILNQ